MDNLLTVHRLVTYNTMHDPNEVGFIRQDDVVKVVDTIDGSTVHQPPPYTELTELLNDLFKFFNEEENEKIFIHPIIKACIIHFMIGYIHPFSDGNGRTARALFYWYMLKRGYWLTEYLSISRLILKSKAAYAMAFLYSEKDGNDFTYFLLYKLRTMKLAFEELRLYIKKKNEEKKQVTDFLGFDGLNYRQALVIEWFRDESDLLITVHEAETRLGVSYMSARGDLTDLVEKGYLSSVQINKVQKGYIKGDKFDSLVKKVKNKAKKTSSDM